MNLATSGAINTSSFSSFDQFSTFISNLIQQEIKKYMKNNV